MYRAFFLSCCVLVCFAPGCGTGEGANNVEVSGIVTLDGQPVEGALVVFTPKTNTKNSQLAAQAETDATGRYELSTYAGGEDFKPGIEPGEYNVSITKLEVVQDMRRQPKHLLPKKYGQPGTSGLSAAVKVDAENVFPFDL